MTRMESDTEWSSEPPLNGRPSVVTSMTGLVRSMVIGMRELVEPASMTSSNFPCAGAATLDATADPRGAALAYRRLGGGWIRVDLADRLASHARKVRSAGGDNPVDAELATSIGLSEDAIARLMAEVGFAKAGDAWRWRGRRPPPDDHRAAPAHAFAELEKLRRK